MPSMPPAHRSPGVKAKTSWTRYSQPKVERITGRAGVALRERIRAEEPLCRHCLAEGRVRPTQEIDHIRPLTRGGTNDRSNLQGLCVPCHEAKSKAERAGQSKPAWLPKPGIPATVVAGPPGAGKTTYVRARAKPGDVILDLDDLIEELTGTHGHLTTDGVSEALWLRNKRLADLAKAKEGRLWLIVSGARSDDRIWWANKLDAEVVLLNPGEAECLRRVRLRPAQGRDHEGAVRAWFNAARA